MIVAAILQRAAAVTGAGVRTLIQKAVDEQFRVGPMLMALFAERQRKKKRA